MAGGGGFAVTPGLVVTVLLVGIGVLNLGALVWLLSRVVTTQGEHERRITAVESMASTSASRATGGAISAKGRDFVHEFLKRDEERSGHDVVVGLGIANKVESNPLVQSLEGLFLPPYAVKLVAVGLNAICGAETIAASAASNTKLTGPQKMAVALAAFEQAYEDHCKELGLPVIPGKAEAILQAVFDLLNVIPASVSASPAAVAAVAAALAAPAAAVVTAAAPSVKDEAAGAVALATLAPAVVSAVEKIAKPAAIDSAVSLAGPGLHLSAEFSN